LPGRRERRHLQRGPPGGCRLLLGGLQRAAHRRRLAGEPHGGELREGERVHRARRRRDAAGHLPLRLLEHGLPGLQGRLRGILVRRRLSGGAQITSRPSAEMTVSTSTAFSNTPWEKRLATLAPTKAPRSTTGISIASITKVSRLNRPRLAEKGSLRMLTIAKNQAAVPRNVSTGSRMA